MPDQFVGDAVPIEHVDDRIVGILLQNLISSMLLRDFQRFVRIKFEEGAVEYAGRGIGGIVGILVAGRDSG